MTLGSSCPPSSTAAALRVLKSGCFMPIETGVRKHRVENVNLRWGMGRGRQGISGNPQSRSPHMQLLCFETPTKRLAAVPTPSLVLLRSSALRMDLTPSDLRASRDSLIAGA